MTTGATVSTTTAYASSGSDVNCFERGIMDGEDTSSIKKHTAGEVMNIMKGLHKRLHVGRRQYNGELQKIDRCLSTSFSYFIAVDFSPTISSDDKKSC
jgi:hypothetical protein